MNWPAPGQPRRPKTPPSQYSAEQAGDGEDAKDDDKDLGDDGADEGAEDAEAARWSLTHDGKPVEKIEVDVGGETKQVSLQEVVKGYSEQEAINQRARQVQEYAQAFEHQERPGRPGDRPGPPNLPAAARLYRPGDGRPLSQGTPTGSRNIPPTPAERTRRRKSSSTCAAAWRSIAHEMQREQAEAQAQYQAQQQYEAQRMASPTSRM